MLLTRQRANDKSANDKPATAAAQSLIAELPAQQRGNVLSNSDLLEHIVLTLHNGNSVHILKKSRRRWFGSVDGRWGYFPSNYVELVRTE